MNDVTRASSYGTDAVAERVTTFLGAVYRWMFVGLGVTAWTASVIEPRASVAPAPSPQAPEPPCRPAASSRRALR